MFKKGLKKTFAERNILGVEGRESVSLGEEKKERESRLREECGGGSDDDGTHVSGSAPSTLTTTGPQHTVKFSERDHHVYLESDFLCCYRTYE